MANTPITTDQDPVETKEWLEAYESVLQHEGADRAAYLLNQLVARASQEDASLPVAMTTPYRNTIPVQNEARMPGDLFMERRIRSLIRWNALAMVMRANKSGDDLGGHIATYQSAATLYEVGFNYFWKGPDHPNGQDLLYIQGHASPGIYARSFLEGRLSENQLDNFRRGRRWRPLILSTSLADARLLAIPNSIHGTRAHPVDLSGPCNEISRESRAIRSARSQGLGFFR